MLNYVPSTKAIARQSRIITVGSSGRICSTRLPHSCNSKGNREVGWLGFNSAFNTIQLQRKQKGADKNNVLSKSGNRTSDIKTVFHINGQSTITLSTAENNTTPQHYTIKINNTKTHLTKFERAAIFR